MLEHEGLLGALFCVAEVPVARRAVACRSKQQVLLGVARQSTLGKEVTGGFLLDGLKVCLAEVGVGKHARRSWRVGTS